MTHYQPGSQSFEVMREKERLARWLIRRGLSDRLIKQQLRCSITFVRRVRQEMALESAATS